MEGKSLSGYIAANKGIIDMKISFDIRLARALSDVEYDRLERAGISIYGECKPSAQPRYEFRCHNAAELAIAQAFLAAFR